MAEVLNIDSIHNNGQAKVVIGIRDKKFVLELDSNTNIVRIYNDKTNAEVNLKVNSVIAEGLMVYCGKYDTMEALITAVNSGSITPLKGWVFYIVNRGGLDIDGNYVTDNSHLVYTGEGWRLL